MGGGALGKGFGVGGRGGADGTDAAVVGKSTIALPPSTASEGRTSDGPDALGGGPSGTTYESKLTTLAPGLVGSPSIPAKRTPFFSLLVLVRRRPPDARRGSGWSFTVVVVVGAVGRWNAVSGSEGWVVPGVATVLQESGGGSSYVGKEGNEAPDVV